MDCGAKLGMQLYVDKIVWPGNFQELKLYDICGAMPIEGLCLMSSLPHFLHNICISVCRVGRQAIGA